MTQPQPGVNAPSQASGGVASDLPPAPRSPVEAQVQRLRELLQQNHFQAALELAQSLAASVPGNRDVLYAMAVAQRYQQRIADALATLHRLEAAHPRFARLFQERGHCYIALRDAPRAIEAFLHAVNVNPALTASWRRLESLFTMTGRMEDARTARSHCRQLEGMPAEVVTANGLFADGELGLAEQLIRRYLLQHGDDVEAMRLLARIGIERDVLDDAETLLAAVLKLAPDYRAARHDFALALMRRHDYLRAEQEVEKLLSLEPEDRTYRTTRANILVGLGRHGEALAQYRQLLVDAPRAAELHLSIAHCLKTLGQQSEAIDAYRAAYRARPSYGDAYWSLANLKTYRFIDGELAAMQTQANDAATGRTDCIHLCFALGKALEERGEFAESFRYYERGNALKRAESRYSADTIEAGLRRQMSTFTPEFFAARVGRGCPAPDPIFIVGLPRAGSTLIEQILASHSQVEGTMELADIPRLVHRLSGREQQGDAPRYPTLLEGLPLDGLVALGERYLTDTRVFRGSGAAARPFFIDKMPNNFRHLGLIRLILPNAKIIDARREALACCVSNFKQLFASGQEFTYSLEDIGRYYRAYVEVMEHWERVLPGWVLRVQHEAVVEDLEGSVRRILGFCGLEFEPQCLQYWKTERSVRTASSEQVRQPIFREGLEQWRHFEPWLGPLKHSLGTLAS